jgi:hypothetical protein
VVSVLQNAAGMKNSLAWPLTVLLSVLSLGAVGCQSSALVDDIDLDLDWTPLIGPSDSLHSPYVLGAQFTLWGQLSHVDNNTSWHIVSGDEGVIKLGETMPSADSDLISAPATVMAAGQVELQILDGNSVKHSHTVTVSFPDRVDILPHGPLLLEESDVASVDTIQLLAGGEGTFLAQYYASGVLLHGYGALAATADPASGIVPNVAHTSFSENRDWLQVQVADAGNEGSVQLMVGGMMSRTVNIVAVPEEAIESVALAGQSTKHASNKEVLTVLAQASDAESNTIYGVDFSFTANGVLQSDIVGSTTPSMGDLYRYTYDKGVDVTLEATHNALSDGLMIQSSGGYVASTNNLGCQGAPGTPRGLPLVVGFWFALYCWRRRGLAARDL